MIVTRAPALSIAGDRRIRDHLVWRWMERIGPAQARAIAEHAGIPTPQVVASLQRLSKSGRAVKRTAACPACGNRGRLTLWIHL